MLECRNVVKKYRSRPAVDDVSFTFNNGSVYALLGPNGSGKSTLMKMMVGLIHQDKGEILFNSEQLREAHRASIAYMPTEPYFYSYMTWKDAGKYYEDFYKDFSADNYNGLLKDFGLDAKMKITRMSSGMTAKGKIALALARNAQVVMLDEPLNGIDVIARDEIIDNIKKHISPDRTFIISSHLVEELENLADETVFLRSGKVAFSGKTAELVAQRGKSLTEIYKDIYTGAQF